MLVDKVKQRTSDLELATKKAEIANIAKTNFMSRISHELNTPLNAILGSNYLLYVNLAHTNEENTQLLNNIKLGAEHLDMLVKDIMDLVQGGKENLSIALEECSLDEILASCIGLLTPLAQEHGVTLNYQRVSANIFANRGRVRQVILNILDNAIKFNRLNGSVELKIAYTAPGRVDVEIFNTGVGIEERNFEAIFEPFYRLPYAGKKRNIGVTFIRK